MRIPAAIIAVAMIFPALLLTASPAVGEQRFLEIVTPDTLEAAVGTIAGTVRDLDSSDDIRATISEADVTALVNAERWLKPDGDSAAGFSYRSGCASAEFECLTDDPIDDGNSSFIVGNGRTPGDASRYSLEDLSVAVGEDITIASLTPWSVSRVNASAESYWINLAASDLSDCTSTGLALTVAFVNGSGGAEASVCGTGAQWTVADVDGSFVEHRESHPQSDLVTVTALGVTATFSDSDFQIVAFVNFSNVRGTVHELRFEGSSALTDSTGLSLQVLRASSWLTIATDFLDVTESSVLLDLNDDGADVVDGLARFRIVDTEVNEESGEDFSLDQFVIFSYESGSIVTPPPGAAFVFITCSFRWPANVVSCEADERLQRDLIAVRIWTVDGVIRQRSEDLNGSRLEFATGIPWWSPGTFRAEIAYEVQLIGGTVITADPPIFSADTLWLGVLYGGLTLVAIAAVGGRMRMQRPRSMPRPRRSEE